MGIFRFMAYWLNEVPDHLKTQKSCIEAAEKCAWLLKYVPNHFKTQEMCNEAVRNHPYTLKYVPIQCIEGVLGQLYADKNHKKISCEYSTIISDARTIKIVS